jgi:NAD(P)H-hydrate epimerase
MQIIEKIPRLRPRAADSHKGDFGKICIIAGSAGFSGAAALAGKAALRAGAGLVRIACPDIILPIVAGIEPSYTTIALPADNEGRISKKAIHLILKAVEENDVIAFGPGVGVSGDLQQILHLLIEQKKLIVIDADGLNNLSKMNDWPEKRKANLILTPHPGEMERLWDGLFRQPMPSKRTEQAVSFAKQTETIIVLKGAGTVVTDGQKVYINKTGNPGMATAGAGDVLTGMITAILGQRPDCFDSAVLGVYVHGLAGDIAAKNKGQISLIATDIIEALPEAFKK